MRTSGVMSIMVFINPLPAKNILYYIYLITLLAGSKGKSQYIVVGKWEEKLEHLPNIMRSTSLPKDRNIPEVLWILKN